MAILEKEEIWKDIPEFNGIYQASNLGRVKSLERIDARGHRVKERILKPSIDRVGYYKVGLCKNSKVRFYLVHRLVWIAFNGSISEGYEINHLDERTVNNRLENLNLVTHKENLNWGTRNERVSKKQINGKRSKTVLQFDLNDNLVKEYPSTKQVERELGFDQGSIVKCCNGKRKTAYNYKWKYK